MSEAELFVNIQSFNSIGSKSTSTTGDFKCKTKYCLNTCKSIISVEHNITNRLTPLQKKLFLKYLGNSKNIRIRNQCLQKLNKIYSDRQFKQSTIFNIYDSWSISELPQSYDPVYKQVLQFYIKNWILEMGYLSQQNKKLILQRIHLSIQTDMIYKAIKIYQNLGKGYLTEIQRFTMLQNLCKNGWEYFCAALKIFCKK